MSLGIFLYAVAQLIFHPPTVADLALPEWQRLAFNIVWIVGGGTAYVGINRCEARWEAFGMLLLATGLVVNFIATLSVTPATGWSGFFTLSLAIGCARRAQVLMSSGYEHILGDEEEWRE